MRKTALQVVAELAEKDDRVVFIGSDLGPDTLLKLKQDRPSQFMMEGVSEAHIVTMAAALALDGKIPYINTIATFLSRRCFEQIVLDLGLHRTRVRLVASGGGFVYAPLGPTHLATDDIAILRTIPNMTILAPADADEMRRLMLQTPEIPGPVYIRVAKGGDPVVSEERLGCQIGKAILLRDGRDALLVTTGVGLQVCLEAAALLASKGCSAAVLHMHTIKPLDESALREQLSCVPVVVSVEEHSIVGGLGSAVAECLAESCFEAPKRFRRLGLPDVFPDQYGSQATLMKRYGISPEAVAEAVLGLIAGSDR
jgi:transketolase